MKPNAKQLTFLYFSIVAFAIIAIHASVFISTTEDMELLYAENRLNKISEFVHRAIDQSEITPLEGLKIQTQGKADFDPFIEAYFDLNNLPDELGVPKDIPQGKAVEVTNEQSEKTYFVLREPLGNSKAEILLVLDNSFYELTEEQLLSTHTKQVTISLVLGLLSLLVVLKISDRLTKPVTRLIADLSNRPPESLESIPIPEGTSTQEVFQLVESFNAFQTRIKNLMERERSFNRYASHELRTSLMVMKGAITLLGESNDKVFIARQKARLEKATNDMNEFVQTLLGLTKIPDKDIVPRQITTQEIQEIVDMHRYLLEHKQVECCINADQLPIIRIPAPVFRILIGNLVKNAFAHTFEGCVTIQINADSIVISDTGVGLQKKEEQYEGYGLGLLLVKDICRQFGCQFDLIENAMGGCDASIAFSQNE